MGTTVEEAENVDYPDELEAIYWRNADGRTWIRRGDIIDYFDETWACAVREWKDWKMFGLPHGSGPLAERPQWIDAVRLVEEEYNFYENRRAEGKNPDGSRRTKGDSAG